jgi:hypothetical protein
VREGRRKVHKIEQSRNEQKIIDFYMGLNSYPLYERGVSLYTSVYLRGSLIEVNKKLLMDVNRVVDRGEEQK